MAIVRKSTLPDNSLPIPAGLYNLAIIKAEYKKFESSGADGVVLELQIVSPAEAQSEGRTVKTAGKKVTHRIVLSPKTNMWVKEIEQLLGSPLPEDDLDTTEEAKAVAEALNPSDVNPIKFLVNVELKPVERFQYDKVTKKEVIGPDGQKVHAGWTFERASREWPKAISGEAAGLA